MDERGPGPESYLAAAIEAGRSVTYEGALSVPPDRKAVNAALRTIETDHRALAASGWADLARGALLAMDEAVLAFAAAAPADAVTHRYKLGLLETYATWSEGRGEAALGRMLRAALRVERERKEVAGEPTTLN